VPADTPLERLLPASSRGTASVTPVDPWAFDADSARRTLLAQLRTHSLEGFGLEAHPAASPGGRGAGSLSEGHAEDGLDAFSAVGVQRARRPADRRSAHAEAPRNRRVDGWRPRGLTAHELDRTMTPMGARLLRRGSSARSSRSSASAIASMRSRTSRSAPPSGGSSGTRCGRCTTSSAWWPERRLAPPGRATSSRSRTSLAAVPRLRQLLSGFQAPFVSSLAIRAGRGRGREGGIEEALVDEPPALAREGGYVRDGVDPELDELRRISTSGSR